MKILVVEDDENKTKQIIEHLYNSFNSRIQVSTSRSYQSGISELLTKSFNLVLLDMSLPTYDITPTEPGGRYRHHAGKEILTEMKRKRKIVKTIVVTQYDIIGEGENKTTLEVLDKELMQSFPEYYNGLVYYNAAISDWKNKLNLLINNAFHSEENNA